MTDEQLFAAYVAGDETGLNELIERYRGPLTFYACNRIDGDELVQAVFIRVVRDKDRFIEGKSIKPWLFTIADRIKRTHSVVKRRAAAVLATPEMEVLAEVYQR